MFESDECSRAMWMLHTLKEHSWTLDAPAEWTECKFGKVTWRIMARKLKYSEAAFIFVVVCSHLILSQSLLWHCSSTMFLDKDHPKNGLGSWINLWDKQTVSWGHPEKQVGGERDLEIWCDVFLPTVCSYLFLPQGSLWNCWSAMFLD